VDSDIRLLLSKTEDFGMTEKQKKMLGRIIAAFVLFVALLIAEHTGMLENVNVWIQFVIYLVPYLIIGYDIVYKAVRNISHGQVFDENFLMMVATFGAFGVKEYSEAVAGSTARCQPNTKSAAVTASPLDHLASRRWKV